MSTGDEVVAVGGDPSRIEDVYACERAGLVRLGAFVTGDVGVADDLVQDAFADLQEVWETVESPAAWLRTAVSRRSVSWVRRRVVARRYLDALDPSGEVVVPADIVGRVRVRRAVAALGPERRAAVFCRYYLDLSEAETARLLGVRPGTVKSRLSRAMRDLKEALDDRP